MSGSIYVTEEADHAASTDDDGDTRVMVGALVVGRSSHRTAFTAGERGLVAGHTIIAEQCTPSAIDHQTQAQQQKRRHATAARRRPPGISVAATPRFRRENQ